MTDPETSALMGELSNLQTWCALMSRKDSGGMPAFDLIQRTRIHLMKLASAAPNPPIPTTKTAEDHSEEQP